MSSETRVDDVPDFDELWSYDDPAATEAAFREILPAAESSGDAGYLAQLLTQIARAEGLQQTFDCAHATLDRAEALLPDEPSVARVRLLLERGRAFNSSRQPETARPLFESAWELARALGADRLAVDAAHMIAIVASAEESLEWNRRAIALAESSDDPGARRWLGSLYNNVGWTLHDQGRYAEALDTFERALAFRREQGTPDPIRIARWCIARTLRSLGRVDEALVVQRELAAEYAEAGQPTGYVHEELGECLLLLGRPDRATPHFAQAYAILSEDRWLQRDEPDRLERLQRLGNVE